MDWIEEREGSLFAYEFKWVKEGKSHLAAWRERYPESKHKVINNTNYLDFITGKQDR